MEQQKKVKLLIVLAMIIIVVLLVTSVALMVNISIAKNELAKQQEQIEELKQKLDYYEHKTQTTSNTYTIEIPGVNL